MLQRWRTRHDRNVLWIFSQQNTGCQLARIGLLFHRVRVRSANYPMAQTAVDETISGELAGDRREDFVGANHRLGFLIRYRLEEYDGAWRKG